jgi:hypothetical protein
LRAVAQVGSSPVQNRRNSPRVTVVGLTPNSVSATARAYATGSSVLGSGGIAMRADDADLDAGAGDGRCVTGVTAMTPCERGSSDAGSGRPVRRHTASPARTATTTAATTTHTIRHVISRRRVSRDTSWLIRVLLGSVLTPLRATAGCRFSRPQDRARQGE